MAARKPSGRSLRIDLGLAVSGALLGPGERRSLADLAAFCGCSKSYIQQLELRALKKLRHPSRLHQLTDH